MKIGTTPRVVAAVLCLAAAVPALASTREVHVTLSGHDPTHEFAVIPQPTEVSAGNVTFVVHNASKQTEHEMVVARVNSHDARLPYDKSTAEVREGKAHALGEVPELEPGATGRVTLDLKPGEYVLFCNVPGHYVAGMQTPLTVK